MKQLTEQVKESLISRLQDIKTMMAANMDALRRTASCRSISSLSIVIENNFKAYLEGDSQWNVMQRGRGAGKGPYNFREIIKDWIQAKGITITPRRSESQESALNSAAYLITRSVIKKGTSLHRSNGYNDIYDSAIEKGLELLDRDVGAFLEADIDNTNTLFIKNDNKNNK